MGTSDISREEIIKAAEELQRQRERDSADPITKFFDQEVPERLWHYTTLSGLEGILRSNTVWATDARHTRDTSEFVHVAQLADAYLSSVKPTSEHEENSLRDARDVVRHEFETGALAAQTAQVFVASFSAARDLKSQWVEYAANGVGVGIAFDLRKVRPPRGSLYAVTMAPCVYSEDQLRPLLETCLGHFVRSAASARKRASDLHWLEQQRNDWLRVNRIFNSPPNENEFLKIQNQRFGLELRSHMALTQYDLLRLASHTKHIYYKEECEWRLALPRSLDKPFTQTTLLHRGTKSEIPYIAHDLFAAGRLPIVEVMTGPFCSGAKVDEIMREHGYSAPITQSRSPERPGQFPTGTEANT
jgi:hypothetical protein